MQNRARPDPTVLMVSWGPALAGVVVAALFAVPTRPADACSMLGPGIYSRSVWPPSGERPPTNTRFVIEYGTSSVAPGQIPPLGGDVILRAVGGAAVDATIEVSGSHVTVRPTGTLSPGGQYQLSDRRAIPCSGVPLSCPLLADPQVFATFTVGPDADQTPPRFDGLASAGSGFREVCNDSACCGPYVRVPATLSWAAATDDQTGADVRYNVYRNEQPSGLILAVPLVAGTSLQASMYCTGTLVTPFLPHLVGGRQLVRAVDWAGNEDTNAVERVLIATFCQDISGSGGTSGGSGGTSGGSGGTSGGSGGGAGGSGGPIAEAPDGGLPTDAATDASTAKPPGVAPRDSGGCGCAIKPAARDASALATLLAALYVVTLRSRRRTKRRRRFAR